MSSSKYANLPDIDTAPDVYETEDVPELGSRTGNFDDDDSHQTGPPSPTSRNQEMDINKGQIDESSLPNMDSLNQRFGALASQTYTLYPSSLPFIRPHLPSSSIPSEHQYPAQDLIPEHPRARIRRLRYEMEELEKDLESAGPGEAAGEEPEEEKRGGGRADIMRELRDLKGRLVAVGGEGSGSKGESGSGTGWEGKLKMLQEGRTNGEVGTTPTKEEENTVAATVAGSDERKVAELDKRLAELEGMIGVGNSGVDISSPLPTPLLPTLQKLDHLLTLLTQPRHLDAISRRVKLLLIDLDKAQQSQSNSSFSNSQKRRSITASSSLDPSSSQPPNPSSSPSNLTPTQLSSLTTLFALLPRLQPLLPLVPHLLARLRSLASLHASAGEFASTLSNVERESIGLREGEKELRGVLEGLEASLKKNEEVMEGNLRGLGERVDKLGERVEGLAR
ncbi:hypothetical protein BDY24DRAFT_389350 [Mrakia frigida]|uniref:uncharacterized protein n=1 Tax=Mrakia frigida TaxID=29902 RepID=UPI003FCC1EC5